MEESFQRQEKDAILSEYISIKDFLSHDTKPS